MDRKGLDHKLRKKKIIKKKPTDITSIKYALARLGLKTLHGFKLEQYDINYDERGCTIALTIYKHLVRK